MKLKRLFTTTLAILATSPLLADKCNPCDPCEQPDPCNECCPNFLSSCICDWSEGNNSWLVESDWIYWKVRNCDLDYVIKGPSIVFPTVLDGDLHNVVPCRDGGFRVALFKGCGDCLRFGLRYTRYETNTHDSISIPEEETLFNVFPTRNFIGSSTFLLTADSTYKMNLEIVDLLSSYLYRFDCTSLAIRPFTGVRIAFIDQDLNTQYTYEGNGEDILGADQSVNEAISMDAYGLMFGLDSEWNNLWCGLGLYGKFATTLSVTRFESSHLETFNEFGNSNIVTTRHENVKERQYLVIPSWEMAVGLDYQLCRLLCACWDIKLGYEFHSWCNLPNFIRIPTGSSSKKLVREKSDLRNDGLFLRLTGIF